MDGLGVAFSLHREVEIADVRLHFVLPSGSRVGRPQTQGPKWHHKRYAGSPSPPGWATERVSPLSASPQAAAAAGPCVTGWRARRGDTRT